MPWGYAAATVAGAFIAADAAGDASDASSASTSAAIAEQQRQYDLNREDIAPWMEAGEQALTEYQNQLAPPSSDYSQYQDYGAYQGAEDFEFNLEGDAGYQFAVAEAEKAVNRGSASQGGFNSGNRLAELGDRITGVASQYANDAFNRQMGQSQENYQRGLTDYGLGVSRNQDLYGRGYGEQQDYLNRLAALSGTGQTATSNLGAQGTNMANQIGSLYSANAANQTNAAYAQSSAIQGGINNALTAYYGAQ